MSYIKMKILEKSPWPEHGIQNYSCIEDGRWGFLIIYENMTYHFDLTQVPSQDEILERWKYALEYNQRAQRLSLGVRS